MNVQQKIEKYSRMIWDEQLPPEEEAFLYDLLEGKVTNGFQYDLDADYSLYLAYNAQKNGFQGYDDGQVQTFQEILNLYRMQKLQKIPAMSRVFKVLNGNDIVPVLVKGAALLCYYAPDLPRMMGDIDIYVQPDKFDQAISLLYDSGFEFVNDTGYHIALTSDKLDIDVHRYIYKNGGDIGSNIYDRLISCSFLGSQVCVLTPEDMLVHQIVNRGQDISLLSHEKRHFKWILDCYSI